MSRFIFIKTKPVAMHLKKAIMLLLLMQTMIFIAKGQDTINVLLKNNQANFNSVLRPLQQIAGAPEPFYSYYWEFGDGHFSFEERPKHIYRDTGLFQAQLFATNNYDDGKPPPLKPKPVKVGSKNSGYAFDQNPRFFKQGGSLEMKVNRMPRPDEDMVLIMGYRNESGSGNMKGSMILFYNEKQFRKNNFNISEERTYNNERRSTLSEAMASSPSGEIAPISFTGGPSDVNSIASFGERFDQLIGAKLKLFRQNQVWRFEDLNAGEEKYFFLTLHTTPEMIKDTNAVVELTGMFIPDDRNAQLEEFTMRLQIVSSHDPNRMMLRNRRLNYRFTGKKKEMEYTVRFQNTGRGPSREITVAIGVPHMLDPRSLLIIDQYPPCLNCKTVPGPRMSCIDTLIRKDSIFFVFRNIYLPGLRQEGNRSPDSTMGFVRYRMHFNKELKKLPFESNAAIVFDNNKPVYTNSPKGYFKAGKSYGLVAGYMNFIGKNRNDENYFSIGASLSPYAPYKKFFQEEIYIGYKQFPEKQTGARTENKDTVINGNTLRIFQRELFARYNIIKLDIVPLQLRYNLNRWLGGGVGTQFSFDAYTRIQNREIIHLQQPPNPSPIILEKKYPGTKWFANFDGALFADVQAGRVRVGPVLGARFLHYFRYPRNAVYIYLMWRL